ncbi:MAG: hypothetical protein KatS3mg118_2665 [Paracoccaceae bacterium]|nr:MAG: hypothetical protein KatS3mg118_2665 [Paracoccaceae bacterium]
MPALGASGAIAGVMGCYARLFPAARLTVLVPIGFIPFFFEMPAMAFAAIWLMMQILPGILSLGQEVGLGRDRLVGAYRRLRRGAGAGAAVPPAGGIPALLP